MMTREELREAMGKTKREVVIKNLLELLSLVKGYPVYEDCIDYAIEELPRIGHWIKYDKEFYVADKLKPVVHSIRECSECHTKIADFCGELKYCPNCKARMERIVEK